MPSRFCRIYWVIFQIMNLRHNASLSETATASGKAYGPRAQLAERVPGDSVSAPCYGAPENVGILAVVEMGG